jgi:hypothetical protein
MQRICNGKTRTWMKYDLVGQTNSEWLIYVLLNHDNLNILLISSTVDYVENL